MLLISIITLVNISTYMAIRKLGNRKNKFWYRNLMTLDKNKNSFIQFKLFNNNHSVTGYVNQFIVSYL